MKVLRWRWNRLKYLSVVEEEFKCVYRKNEVGFYDRRFEWGDKVDLYVIVLLVEVFLFNSIEEILNIVFLGVYFINDIEGLFNGFNEVFKEVLKFVSEVN